jgi:integrase/recombinase XerC
MTKPAAKPMRRKNPDNLYQRNGVWWIRYNVGGEKVRRSLGTKSVKEAKRLRDQILGKRSAAARFGIEAPVPRKERTFGEVLELWLQARDSCDYRESTRKATKRIARLWLRPYFGKKLMSEIRVEHIEAFLSHLRTVKSASHSKRLSQATIAQIYHKLGTMYRQALKRQWYVGPNPLEMLDRKPSAGNGRDEALTVDEAKRLLDALSGVLYYKAALALATGLRWGEVHGLAWDDITLETTPATLTVRRSYSGPPKNKASAATVPLSDDAVALLRCWRSEQGDGARYLFPHSNGEITKSDTGYGLKAAATQAKIAKNVHPHLFRHTFGTWVFERTGDVKLVQRLMRHASFATSMKYVHDRRELSTVVNRLPSLHTPQLKAA